MTIVYLKIKWPSLCIFYHNFLKYLSQYDIEKKKNGASLTFLKHAWLTLCLLAGLCSKVSMHIAIGRAGFMLHFSLSIYVLAK